MMVDNRSYSAVWSSVALAAVSFVAVSRAHAQTFVPTSGTADWNLDGNWSAPPFPNATGAAAIIPEATADLTVNLNQSITVGSLDIHKSATVDAVTTIADGGASGMLTFDGGTATLTNATSPSPAGNGVSIVNAPIAFTNGMTVVQNDDTGLQLMKNITGTGNLNITRIGAGTSGGGVVALSGSDSYSGSTILTGTDSTNFLLVRLNNTNAIPGGIGATGGTSNILFTHSAILGLRSDDFLRSIGIGPDQFQMPTNTDPNHAVQSGWAAFAQDRTVNIGGAGATVQWGSAGFDPNILVLGHTAADKTITFANTLDLGSGTRNIRAANGTADTDAVLSGGITSSSGGSLIFWGTSNTSPGGTIRLTGASTYGGTTSLRDGVIVILDNAAALPSGNLSLVATGGKGTNLLGLGNGNSTFTRQLGTGANQIQFAGQAGFAAYGGNRAVNLGVAGPGGSGETVTWGSGSFVPNGSSLLLSFDNSDSMIDFQNAIDLANAARGIAVRDGSAPIDATVSGVISGGLNLSALQKNLAGTLALTNANTYAGDTTITDGVLLANNTTGSATGTGNVNVNAGALGGTGSVSGLVTVNVNGHIAPGSPGAADKSLGVSALITQTGSFLDFDLGAPGAPGVSSDLINVTAAGGLTLNGGAVELSNAGGLAAGTYSLIKYAGTLGGDVANLGTPTGPGGFTYSLMNNAGASSIDLLVTAASLAGDYNHDGVVSAADYIVWRNNPNDNGGTPGGYNTWRANFGNSLAGSGSSLGGAAVPEPATIGLFACVLPLFGSFVMGRRLGRTRS